mgnify:CR=1 FL=1
MRIDVESRNNGAILRPGGKIIGDSVPQLRQAVEEQIRSGAEWLILDLAEVPLMDSSALGTVIVAFLRLREKNGRLIIANAQKNILDVLAITKLDSLFEIQSDMQVALKSVEQMTHGD